jgi:hypothetical protein
VAAHSASAFAAPDDVFEIHLPSPLLAMRCFSIIVNWTQT